MTVATETNIFRSDDLAIDFFSWRNGLNDTVAITFTPFGIPGAVLLDGAGYGGELLLRNDFDVIAFKSTRNLWYQNVSSEHLAAVEHFIAARAAKYARRVGYGSSMGGYAAIQFSRRLKLDIVLAISPQFEIDKPYDQRWQAAAQLIDFRYRIDENAIADHCKYFAAYDPVTEDLRHVEKLRELIRAENLVEIPTPFSGHPAGHYLAETGLIKDLALSVLQDGTVEHIAVGAHRKRSKTYLFEMSLRLVLKNKFKSALVAIDKAIAIDGAVPRLHKQRSLVLDKLGQPEAALAAIDRAIEIGDDAAELFIHRSIILDRLGRRNEALVAAYEARGKIKNDAQLMGALSDRLARHEDFAGALALVDMAIGIDASDLQFHLHRSAVCRALGDIPAAISAGETALQISPHNTPLLVRLAKLHARQGGLEHWSRSLALAGKAVISLMR